MDRKWKTKNRNVERMRIKTSADGLRYEGAESEYRGAESEYRGAESRNVEVRIGDFLNERLLLGKGSDGRRSV